MNAKVAKLIRVLADGRYHSGEQLGAALGISRAAVWKQLKHLRELQLDVEARPGTGYRLRCSVDLFDKARLIEAYQVHARRPAAFEIVDSTGSTNSDLLTRATRAAPSPQFLFAEHQHAGRGRRGRRWVTPYAGSIAFSFLRRFERAPAELGALSLVAGLSLVEALQGYGASDLGLKWPNDLVHRSTPGGMRKLGGILVEIRSEAQGPCAAVIGTGINFSLPAGDVAIDQPWIDLRALLKPSAPDRSAIAGALAAALSNACDELETVGSARYLARWPEYDVLYGEQVDVFRGAETFAAVARGIDDRGALLVETGGARLALQSGEVSIRRHA